MSEQVTHHHVEEHPENHEHADVSLRGIAITLAVLVVVIAATIALLYGLHGALDMNAARVDLREQRTAVEADRAAMPESTPKLQGVPTYHDNTPAADTLELARKNRQILSSSRTKSDGFRQIPIEQAKQLIIDRNLLPARVPPGQEAEQN